MVELLETGRLGPLYAGGESEGEGAMRFRHGAGPHSFVALKGPDSAPGGAAQAK